MKANAATDWIQKNGKGLAVGIALLTILTVVCLTIYKLFFKKQGGTAPGVSNPKEDPYEASRAQAAYNQVAATLTKDPLYYKSLADSLQGYLQTTTFFFSSDVFDKYFKDLAANEFIALYYYWGTREYSGSFWSNPFQGVDDKYGSLTEALKARCFEADYDKIKNQFASTGLI